MPPVIPFPPPLFARTTRHVVVFAHQDDELPYAGLIQRMGPETCFVWITNGDGTHMDVDETPEVHAARREAETREAMALLGCDADRLHFLGYSELALYAAYGELARTGEVPEIFDRAARDVEAVVAASQADAAWTLAYQGGHIEHDMAHLCAARAVRAQGRPLPLYALPAYELVFAIPLRFRPWRREAVHEIWLTREELTRKKAMFDVYTSQAALLATFKKLIGFYGMVNALRLRPFSFDDYARREEFAPVAPDRDYSRSSHRWTALDYLFESYEGTPLRFGSTTRRLAAHFGLG